MSHVDQRFRGVAVRPGMWIGSAVTDEVSSLNEAYTIGTREHPDPLVVSENDLRDPWHQLRVDHWGEYLPTPHTELGDPSGTSNTQLDREFDSSEFDDAQTFLTAQ